jgi:DNA-binding MarR family transcriptional regulator
MANSMDNGLNGVADGIVDSLMRLPPLVRAKLLRPLAESLGGEVSHPHFLILKILAESGPQPVSGVARCALLSRPELTLISDRLVDLGFVERQAGEADRRVTILSVTDKGRQFVKDTMARTRRILRGSLSGLTPEELKELAGILTRLAELAAKIE